MYTGVREAIMQSGIHHMRCLVYVHMDCELC